MNAPAKPVNSPVLPRYTAAQAQAGSLIARHGGAMRLTLPPADAAAGARATEWQVRLTPGVTEPVRAAASQTAAIEWAGARFVLAVPPSAAYAWLAARFDGVDVASLPVTLQTAALEILLNDAVAALGKASSAGPARIVEAFGTTGGQPAALPHTWTLTARSGATGETVTATLACDALGLMLLAGLVQRADPAANELDQLDLPVVVRVRVGDTVLSNAELRSLHVRDVLLLDHYLVSPDGELWLATASGQGVRVRAHDSAYLVTKGWTALMTQTTQPAAPADGEAPLDLDAIPVRLEFDLGDRHISLSDLRKLQPGEVFALDRPLADGAVHIRANGALIGTGELVDVDGRVGVAIRTLGKARA